MSTRTGPQRPVRATWNAAFIVSGCRDIRDEPGVLHDRHRDPGDVALLEGVASRSGVATWPVMQTSGVESDQASAIGVTRFVAPGPRSRTRRRPGPSPCVALRHVAGALLVAGEHVPDARASGHGVVGGHDRPAGNAEHDVDALGLQRPEDRVGSVHSHSWCPSVSRCLVPSPVASTVTGVSVDLPDCGRCASDGPSLAGENVDELDAYAARSRPAGPWHGVNRCRARVWAGRASASKHA